MSITKNAELQTVMFIKNCNTILTTS